MNPRHDRAGRRGFSLLELIIAVTLLAVFLLPMMLVITKCKVRAIQSSQQRELRDLAQRKLFDRIYYIIDANSGDFTAERHPDWTWEIDPPEIIGQGEQPLLEYTIRVTLPQNLSGGGSSGGEGTSYEMSVWTFPDQLYLAEQYDLYQQGQYSPLYGNGGVGGTY